MFIAIKTCFDTSRRRSLVFTQAVLSHIAPFQREKHGFAGKPTLLPHTIIIYRLLLIYVKVEEFLQ